MTNKIGPPVVPARLTDREIREIVRRVLKAHRGRRDEIAARLTEWIGSRVSVNMLNDWCTPTKPGLRFPLSLVRALCEITGNDDLAFAAMTDDLRERAEIGTALRPLLRKWAEQQRRREQEQRAAAGKSALSKRGK
ncbi:MAG TPA: hypothetical protein VGY31_06845 [Terriglobia bacterium]|nr:hypothetical protein [Terriglobia bacterium]